jgi:xanthine dehydrogenase molybdopterin-binding subunit B
MSLNPDVDIGQIEGAFVTGIGQWVSETMIYDKVTGELLTNNTWVCTNLCMSTNIMKLPKCTLIYAGI